MAGQNLAVLDQLAHQFALAAFAMERHRRRRAFLAAADLAQVQRGAQPALGLAQQHDVAARALEGHGHVLGHVVEQADGADGRGRLDRGALGLVVERDVARHDREIQVAAGLAHAPDGFDDLAHDLGLFGIAEIQVVGDRQRHRAGGRQVAIGLGHRLAATLVRVGLAIARRAVGSDGDRLVAAVDAHHGGVAARTLHGVAHDHVVVLLVDPALGGQIRAGQQLLERIGGADVFHVLDVDHRLLGGLYPRAVVFRRRLGQGIDGQVGDDLAMALEHHAARVGQGADDGEVQLPLVHDRAGHVFLARLDDHEHAFLRLGQHDLIGAHALFAHGDAVEVQFHAQAALGRHLERGRGQAGRAHVLDGDDDVGGHQLQAGFDQQLLGEGVADLDGGTLLLGILVELGRGHGGAVDAVAAGLRAEIHHRIADAGGGRIEDVVLARQTHGHGVDQDVAVIRAVEIGFAAHGGDADAIAVAADAGHHARHQMAGLGVAGIAEAQRVHVGDGARAHGEHVAQDAAHAGRRALIGFDEAGVVVAFHLEDDGVAVADVDDAGVLARAADHPRRLGRQGLQPLLRRLVRAVLGPHDREDAQLGQVRLAAHDLEDQLVLVGLDAVARDDFGGNLAHDSASTSESNISLPSDPPSRSSAKRSGCGIRPSTLNLEL